MLESAGRAVLATLAAGLLWRWLDRFGPLPAFAAAGSVYLLVWAGLEVLDRKLRRPELAVRWPLTLRPLALDALGWAAGLPLALVGTSAGWGLTAALAVVLGLALAEVVRNAFEREAAFSRARDFERLRRAARRMSTPQQEMTAVAERIRLECAKVIPFHWLQLEAMAPGSELKSWWWGPESEALAEGVPMPERFPPVLPGFHRRSNWQIVERSLLAHADGKLLGRLRLWCDPRRLEPGDVELLDRLLPQMTTAVERCLLDREAREDPLTGVAMRRILEPRLHEAHARCCEEGGSMAVLLCDLDHFKRINDTHGHPAGDAALVAVAAVLKTVCRTQDLVCRYGGEEFVVLMDGAGGQEALAVAERLRHAVEALDFQVEGEKVPLTLSCGVASFPELHVKTGAELILFADEALYEAKRTGRNRCLLDVGQGRYQDPEGHLHQLEEAQEAPEAPRIFA
jgi:diguanylate cyclase (GGDEF)-like protein